jgi:hypothetical protein
MSVVMDSEQMHSASNPPPIEFLVPLDGEVSVDGVRVALGTFPWQQCAGSLSDRAREILHQMASDMNKSKRQLSPQIGIIAWER